MIAIIWRMDRTRFYLFENVTNNPEVFKKYLHRSCIIKGSAFSVQRLRHSIGRKANWIWNSIDIFIVREYLNQNGSTVQKLECCHENVIKTKASRQGRNQRIAEPGSEERTEEWSELWDQHGIRRMKSTEVWLLLGSKATNKAKKTRAPNVRQLAQFRHQIASMHQVWFI